MAAKQMKTLKATKGHLQPDMPMRELPSFTLEQNDLPAIKNWRVGGKYRLEVEVEMVRLSKNEYREGEPISARFKLKKLKDLSLTEEEKRARKGY